MDRLVPLYRGTSSAWAVASLVVANLVPLAGVIFWGWNLWTILALYWAENGIVGLWNIAKILRAEGPVPASAPAAARLVSRAGVAMFFVVHYGIFWVVHGIFVIAALPALDAIGQSGLTPPTLEDPGVVDPWLGERGIRARLDLVAFGAIWLAISHGISYWTVYLGRGEYRHVSPQQQAQAPYGRLVVLHVTIIFGAFVSVLLGVPFGAMLVLVGLKLVLDLRFHLREHGRALPERSPPGV